MKRIGIVVDNEFDSDIRVRKEVDILIRNGYKVFVLCFAYEGKEYQESPDLTIHRIPINKRRKDILTFFFNRIPLYEQLWKKAIRQFVIDYKLDAIHAHDLYMSKAAHLGIKASGSDIPMILDLHENYPEAVQAYNWTKGVIRQLLANPRAWFKKEKRYLSYPKGVVVLSEDFKTTLTDRYDFVEPQSVLAFSNVIDLRRFERYSIDESVSKSDQVTLMYFGAVAERRGVFQAMDAVAQVKQEGYPVDLLIIGPTDNANREKFEGYLQRAEVQVCTKYIPWIDLSELVSYLHISDICISPLEKNPQHESGVANKLFQYMFGAKPLIVSDCKPQMDLVKAFECGLSYSTYDEFVACIKELVNDPALRERLGQNGYDRLYEEYDNEAYEQKFLHF
ncbi:MAG: glycosyltransferase, partial [Bacteroidia bacterium]